MRNPCYINSCASIHPEGLIGEDRMLHATEPDYKSIIENANIRRRMSHIVKMGVACGINCLQQNEEKRIDAIITATGLGCLADTEKFLNTLLDNDEQLLNPSPFIQSTFNTIGAQIALLSGNQAYNNTYVHRGLSFESALIDAMMKIWEGYTQVLVGTADEVLPSEYIILKRLGMLENIVLGEGAHFFTLAAHKNQQTYAELVAIKTVAGELSAEEIKKITENLLKENSVDKSEIGHLITGKNGNRLHDEVCDEVEHIFPSAAYSTFKNICGEYPTASAFGFWNGVNLLKKSSDIQYVLIYNNYYNINHSLILLKKC